jgi:rsbT co-antagonist protein RsbR
MSRLELHDRLLRAVLDVLPLIVCGYDRDGHFTFQDGKKLADAGLVPGQFLGKNVFDLYGENPESARLMRLTLAGEPMHHVGEAHNVRWETWYLPVREGDHDVTGMISATADASEAMLREQALETKVERKQRVIRDLSTPIIEIWDGVLMLPLVGVVDSARTAEVMQSLLEVVASKRARFAVLDLTGVDMVDTRTASYLVELVGALRLLGAEGIITGIRSTVAQTMVSLGLDLSGIATYADLRAGLKRCIQRMSSRRS